MPSIPEYYTVFFLWVEPIATLAGAVAAAFFGHDYLVMTHAQTTPSKILGLPIATDVAMRQLGNLYMAFALSEALVLRSTNDVKVWRAMLTAFICADVGHLVACFPAGGFSQYYNVLEWNLMAYGNLLFVYCGAALRICFLAGVGLGPKRAKRAPRKAIKGAPTTVEDEFAQVATPSPKEMNKTPAQSTRRRKSRGAAS